MKCLASNIYLQGNPKTYGSEDIAENGTERSKEAEDYTIGFTMAFCIYLTACMKSPYSGCLNNTSIVTILVGVATGLRETWPGSTPGWRAIGNQ